MSSVEDAGTPGVPGRANVATPEPVSPGAGDTLTSDQAALRDRMTTDGVVSSTCTG